MTTTIPLYVFALALLLGPWAFLILLIIWGVIRYRLLGHKLPPPVDLGHPASEWSEILRKGG